MTSNSQIVIRAEWVHVANNARNCVLTDDAGDGHMYFSGRDIAEVAEEMMNVKGCRGCGYPITLGGTQVVRSLRVVRS